MYSRNRYYLGRLFFVLVITLVLASCEDVSVQPPAPETPVATPDPVSNGDDQPVDSPVPEARPELCHPDNPEFQALESVEVTDSDILDGDIALVAEYVNANGQRFIITAHSLQGEAARAYLAEALFCFEATEVGPPSGIEAVSPSFQGILLATISDSTGLSLEELRAARDEYGDESQAAGVTPTVAGLLEWLGYDPNDIFDTALERTQEEIEAARANGLLFNERADELIDSLRGDYEELFQDEEFTIMAEAILDWQDDFARDLIANPENIVVEMEWVDSTQEGIENYIIFFAIDPPIGANKSHWYSWKRQTYVDARLYVSGGKTGAYIYRWEGSSCRYLTGTVKEAVGWSPTGEASSSTERWFTLRVYGWDSSNVYSLYGSWRGSSFTEQARC